LAARVGANRVSPEASGRPRIWELENSKSILSTEEQSELKGLTAPYPPVIVDPRDLPLWVTLQPMAKLIAALKEPKKSAASSASKVR
jgi:hypothetical protein